MSGDRLAFILARQKQAHDRRKSALEEQRRREREKERRVHKLPDGWKDSHDFLEATADAEAGET